MSGPPSWPPISPRREAVGYLRRHRFKVRETVDADGVRHVYGDRNQYFRLATLLTHLGLILFLAGGAITGAFGFETVLFVGQGQTAPIQPVGTPDNLLIKNLGFQAPQRPDGTYEDYRTNLAVYQDGKQVAQATIRVNEPLTFDGFVFHQNTFGPAEDLEIRDTGGTLVWSGPMILDGSIGGQPQGFMTIPGAPIGLLGLLGTDAKGAPSLTLLGVAAGSGQDQLQPVFADALGDRRDERPGRHRRLPGALGGRQPVQRHGRQEGPRPGLHLGRLPVPHQRAHPDVLLPAAAGLGALRRGTGPRRHAGRPLRAGRAGVRPAARRPRRAVGRRPGARADLSVPTLGELQLAIFPTAVRLAPPDPEPLTAPVAWVRVMKARTPAFDALEPGDLAIVPEAALDLLTAEVEAGDALAALVRAAGACALLLVGAAGGIGGGPGGRGRGGGGECHGPARLATGRR